MTIIPYLKQTSMTKSKLEGVFSPVLTPFDIDLKPNADRLIEHCQWLLSNDVGLAVFGTNSEGNSLSLKEKFGLLERLVDAQIPSARMMPGTGSCALTETIELTKKAVSLGCGGVLMLPPFYYKNNDDEGLYRYFSEVIERVGDDRLRIFLYNIPQVTHVKLSLKLTERLLKNFPEIVAGVKDSSGDWDHTQAMLREFQPEGFQVFSGSESFLLQTLRAGGAGCISATANVNPGAIAKLAKTWTDADADQQQEELIETRMLFQGPKMIAAMKAAIAHYRNDAEWNRLRPPLRELEESERAELITSLEFRVTSLG